MIEATVVGQGLFYTDGTERLYIHILKSLNHGLPNKEGKQVPITVEIGGSEYRGTLGSRTNLQYLYVGAKLWDTNGKEYKQTYLLRDNGFIKGQHVPVSGLRKGWHLPVIKVSSGITPACSGSWQSVTFYSFTTA